MLKRLFDFTASLLGLIILSPILVVVAIWIKLDSKGGVFFRQQRVGLNGELFAIHKFRTMRENTEQESRLTIGADNRITRSGQFLRKSKLDELPQLIDVVMGKMSLVGPRPEVPEFIDLYPEEQRKKILSVRPGITDKASIEMVDENEILGQYEDARQAYIDVIMPMKVKYYLEYVDNNSLLGDIKLIFLTFKKVVTR
ncbi:sugar transferase [Pasteurella atlantica]|uniref:sugar transferase n=1 Tax=Pasteurellaceae TaxID=712 RepID=UPI0027577694|nr:sugar transferase [Pasteurella atlantica]MDP8032890.1 sugar transferase [Pasteurella atlantica]MDP8034953.1 sugar transferase [Pasteurella atlantica]MDP8036777.1 sugar transferase [Pasteurella atlantica]MDP8047250.1 sugar transferase [Pasteurella atlantica]MDP8049240.1 sugar transferase [Pasteurella atlantica]